MALGPTGVGSAVLGDLVNCMRIIIFWQNSRALA